MCLDVNQGGTDRSRCTQTLVILHTQWHRPTNEPWSLCLEYVTEQTRNTALVGKQTTAVPKAAQSIMLMCVNVTKVGQGHLKLLLVQRLH